MGEIPSADGNNPKPLRAGNRISFTRANELINGKRGFTPDTALRVAKYLGTSPEFWMNWQATYDLQRARKEHAKDYRKIKTVTAA